MDRVIGMDAAFLELESPTMHLHVVGVLVLRPSAAAGALPPERLAGVFADRLHLIAPFRRRMVPVPGGLDHPRWIDDPDFDLAQHLHHRHLGPDAGRDELEQFVGEVASSPLHRGRPLWETWLVDGFADGTVALVTKVHHALMDGAAGGDMMASLFDLEPEPGPTAEPPAWEGERSPHPARLVVDAAPAALRRVSQLPAVVVRTLAGLIGSARAVAAQPSSLAGFAPVTPFNGPLTATRTVAFARCPLDDLKEVRQVFGTTINDVVLAAATASLRSYLQARGACPEGPLVASVPVAARHRAGGRDLGNSTSNMMVSLPVHLDDPVEVLRSIHEGAVGAKATQAALEPEVIDQWVGLLPAGLLTAGARDLLGHGPRSAPSTDVQHHRVQRARIARPAVPGRSRGRRHVPHGPADREHRAQPDRAQPDRRPRRGGDRLSRPGRRCTGDRRRLHRRCGRIARHGPE